MACSMPRMRTLLPHLASIPIAALEVAVLAEDYRPDPARVPPGLHAAAADRAGSTSIRNVPKAELAWKDKGYFERNRDLGQVFNLPPGRDRAVEAVVVRTGNSERAVWPGAPGAILTLQFLRVEGEPRIDDNGTSRSSGRRPDHGLSGQYRADDRIIGVRYIPIASASGGRFPALTLADGRLRHLRLSLGAGERVVLSGGGRYAFLVGIAAPASAAGFTLGNHNQAGSDADGELLRDPNGLPWWGIRREGDGVFPPRQVPGAAPPEDAEAMRRQAMLPGGEDRFAQPPGSEGYPDVDTYRTLAFAVELAP